MRNKHSPAFKLKVVLETYKGLKTIAQLSSEYKVHANQIHKWKSKFEKEGASVFTGKQDKEKEEQEKLIDELYKQIGQLKVERDWLKKKSELLFSG